MVIALAIAPGLARGEDAKGQPPRPKTAARTPAAAVKRWAAPVLAAAAARVWHTKPPGQVAPVDGAGRPMLVLQALNVPERVTLTASTEHGGFSAPDLDRAARLLRDTRSNNEHPIDARLLDLVYRVALHFTAHEVRVISGYRTPKPGSHSNHGQGRAIDLVVPGASDEEVAKFARDQGFCGVGVYPTSGFVHLDIRDRSFFWVDYSGPGKKNRTRGILADLAAKADARALSRGEHGAGPFGISTDVDAVLARTNVTGATTTPVEDDDTDEASAF